MCSDNLTTEIWNVEKFSNVCDKKRTYFADYQYSATDILHIRNDRALADYCLITSYISEAERLLVSQKFRILGLQG